MLDVFSCQHCKAWRLANARVCKDLRESGACAKMQLTRLVDLLASFDGVGGRPVSQVEASGSFGRSGDVWDSVGGG